MQTGVRGAVDVERVCPELFKTVAGQFYCVKSGNPAAAFCAEFHRGDEVGVEADNPAHGGIERFAAPSVLPNAGESPYHTRAPAVLNSSPTALNTEGWVFTHLSGASPPSPHTLS
jgi:hypothetical protein